MFRTQRDDWIAKDLIFQIRFLTVGDLSEI